MTGGPATGGALSASYREVFPHAVLRRSTILRVLKPTPCRKTFRTRYYNSRRSVTLPIKPCRVGLSISAAGEDSGRPGDVGLKALKHVFVRATSLGRRRRSGERLGLRDGLQIGVRPPEVSENRLTPLRPPPRGPAERGRDVGENDVVLPIPSKGA
jgi:hypothetical protein